MKVAVIHYWLVSMRGGEKVLENILELFPNADVFTHVYIPQKLSSTITSHTVFTSSINRLPFAATLYKLYMPLMPNALLEFDLQNYDLVISSEAGPAKGVVCAPDAYHICYCHSPMRYLWDMYHPYLRSTNALVRFFMKLLFPKLRIWDITSSNLVDFFIANSTFVASRIKRYYRRDAAVVFAPADIENFTEKKRDVKDYYLFFGQLAENKCIDIALELFCSDKYLQDGKKLVVAGGGASKKMIASYKKCSNITFLGRVSEAEKQELFAQARALIFPGIEDMGLIPIEANSAGCPVIAFRKGGALDTIAENKTGIFFDEQTAVSLDAAIETFEASHENFNDRAVFREHVQKFSRDTFKHHILQIIDDHVIL
ncbi:MAG: glycosyltransferase [Termitinemataceae bacterium]|nr:MAG: glycosyltransferase [Termitinemataceae bacterium]